jgi:hypothetical protein
MEEKILTTEEKLRFKKEKIKAKQEQKRLEALKIPNP